MGVSRLPWSVPELLPHRGPMVLIDDLVDAGEGWVTAGVRIAEDCLFFEPGAGMPCWIGIEYMAQTVALYSGLHAKRAGEPIRIGLLLGARRHEAMTDYFPLGSYLEIHAREQWQDGQMGIFDCSVEGGRCLAKARLNVFSPPDARVFLASR
jgi:predicted hotdog family 3-hydroxylacyl-ACP dehydratase